MSTLNKIILIGRLGKDVDLSQSTNGTAVAKFTLATSNRWVDREGSAKEKTEWHNIRVVGKKATLCKQYLAKGRRVYLEGESTTRSYEQDGKTLFFHEVFVKEMVFLEHMRKGEDEIPGLPDFDV